MNNRTAGFNVNSLCLIAEAGPYFRWKVAIIVSFQNVYFPVFKAVDRLTIFFHYFLYVTQYN